MPDSIRKTTPPNVADLMCARMCHDLVSPISAIGSGLELLQMTGMSESPELQLISESLSDATARIEFFRIAYGNASPEAQVDADTAAQILSANFSDKRCTASWDVPGILPREDVKLLFLLAQCAKAVLPRGGGITCRAPGHGRFQVAAQGQLHNDLAPLEVLASTAPPESVISRTIQFELARICALDLGRRIAVQVHATGVQIDVE